MGEGDELGDAGGRRSHWCKAHNREKAVEERRGVEWVRRVGAGEAKRSGRDGRRACGRCLVTAVDNTSQSLLRLIAVLAAPETR